MSHFSSRALLGFFISLCVASAHGHNKVVVIPMAGDDAPPPTVYAIGDTGPAGGKVFLVFIGGLHGLEAAPVDQASATWGCSTTDVAGVDNLPSAGTQDSHSGAANTLLIAEACGGAAAVAADYIWPNGQTDGFLPNKEELNLLYHQKDVVGGFASIFYWSSSENDSDFAWLQFFGNGVQTVNSKDNANGVRAVRAF